MKQLTEYITEKANFLVKKHVSNAKNVILNANEVKNGMYYKLVRDNDVRILGKICESGEVIKTFKETGKQVFHNEFVQAIGVRVGKHINYPVIYKSDYGTPEGFADITDDDWEIIHDIEKYIDDNPHIKPGYQIGIVRKNKFIPNDNETNNKLYN